MNTPSFLEFSDGRVNLLLRESLLFLFGLGSALIDRKYKAVYDTQLSDVAVICQHGQKKMHPAKFIQ